MDVKIMLVINILLFLATSIATAIAYYQYGLAKAALDDAKQSSKDSSIQIDRLITANEKLAAAASNQADSLKQSVDAANRSAEAAEKSASVAYQTFGPYIGIKFDPVSLEVGQQAKIRMKIENAGRSPAFNLRWETSVQTRTDMLPANPKPGKLIGLPESQAFLPPGHHFTQTNHSAVLSETWVTSIKSGKAFLFVYGRGTFSDGLQTPHKLDFCYFYNHRSSMLSPCPHGNSYE